VSPQLVRRAHPQAEKPSHDTALKPTQDEGGPRRRLFQGGGLLADLRSDRAKLDAERQRTYEDPAEHDARTCILAWWSASVARPRDDPPIKKRSPSGKAEA
jgi:hypothetical protein